MHPDDHTAPLVVRLQDPANPGEPEPTYGRQLDYQALIGEPIEGHPVVTWQVVTGEYPDGKTWEFKGHLGAVDPTAVSVRLPPPVFGVGLLESVPESNIMSFADPEDSNGDGISGVARRVEFAGEARLGRFGWKAGLADLTQLTARALWLDMGVTSTFHPMEDDADATTGEPEVGQSSLNRLETYVRLLGVPPPKEGFEAGRAAFEQVGCDDCHRSALPVRAPVSKGFPTRRMTIAPYTDLLLHDLGHGLADKQGEPGASASEWRTPPLWGLGSANDVNSPVFYLHDGRARTVEEAILWHGGEAQSANREFQSLPSDKRRDLLAFVGSL